jgi:hypothetical protein
MEVVRLHERNRVNAIRQVRESRFYGDLQAGAVTVPAVQDHAIVKGDRIALAMLLDVGGEGRVVGFGHSREGRT